MGSYPILMAILLVVLSMPAMFQVNSTGEKSSQQKLSKCGSSLPVDGDLVGRGPR